MADSTTTNYGWAYPTVNADADTWGTTLNNALMAADASLKTVETAGMKGANNLSECTNDETARANIGVRVGTIQIFVAGSDPAASAQANDVWLG